MSHARAITFATASVAVFTTFGLYARQDAQEDQAPVFQVEQTPSRTAGATAHHLYRSPAGGPRREISRR
jgi:hypothetical protein